MNEADAALAALRAIQDRVRGYRFRGAERYLADLDEFGQDLRRLADAIRAIDRPEGRMFSEQLVMMHGTARMPSNDGPVDVPLTVLSGCRQVIVVRTSSPARARASRG